MYYNQQLILLILSPMDCWCRVDDVNLTGPTEGERDTRDGKLFLPSPLRALTSPSQEIEAFPFGFSEF